ncbi:hypothetical protein [Streptomyces sp. NPDC058045]|uniref:hypothetical protein n=1 Tax=Streptomyces sp. NPDC058045 TaxID=3346311 RepID=UPI0036E97245
MTSRLPELIDAVVAACTTAPGLDGVQVIDGPAVTDSRAGEWLIVGYDGDAGGTFEAGQTEGGWATLGTDREERLQLVAAIVVLRGGTDVRAARARAYEIAAPLEQLLAASPSLGMRSAELAIGASALVQEQTDRGAQVRLLLQLTGRAFT